MKYRKGQIVFAASDFVTEAGDDIAKGTKGVVVGPADDGPFDGPAVKISMAGQEFSVAASLLTTRRAAGPAPLSTMDF